MEMKIVEISEINKMGETQDFKNFNFTKDNFKFRGNNLIINVDQVKQDVEIKFATLDQFVHLPVDWSKTKDKPITKYEKILLFKENHKLELLKDLTEIYYNKDIKKLFMMVFQVNNSNMVELFNFDFIGG